MRLPRPRKPEIISLPRIDRKPIVKPMRSPVTMTGSAAGSSTRRNSCHSSGAHRAGNRDEARVDLADPADRVQHDRKKCVARAKRDLGFDADAEEQNVQRQEHDQRNGEYAGEQRLEHQCRVARTADEIADQQAADAGDAECDEQLK